MTTCVSINRFRLSAPGISCTLAEEVMLQCDTTSESANRLLWIWHFVISQPPPFHQDFIHPGGLASLGVPRNCFAFTGNARPNHLLRGRCQVTNGATCLNSHTRRCEHVYDINQFQLRDSLGHKAGLLPSTVCSPTRVSSLVLVRAHCNGLVRRGSGRPSCVFPHPPFYWARC